jgi:hypothetical protein
MSRPARGGRASADLNEPLLPSSAATNHNHDRTGSVRNDGILVEERRYSHSEDMLFITAPSNLPGNYRLEVNLPSGTNNPVTVIVVSVSFFVMLNFGRQDAATYVRVALFNVRPA